MHTLSNASLHAPGIVSRHASSDEPLVALLDDDRAARHSGARLLEEHGFAVATYSSAAALLADVDARSPACVVADLSPPGLIGLELQRALGAHDRDYPVVFVTAQPDARASVLAMRRGAVDLLIWPFEPAELLDAVQRGVERSRASALASRQRRLIEEQLSSLTRREREVFELVVEGRMNKQIAATLTIAEKTVKVHRARVMQKMSVRSVAALARVAERFGTTHFAAQ